MRLVAVKPARGNVRVVAEVGAPSSGIERKAAAGSSYDWVQYPPPQVLYLTFASVHDCLPRQFPFPSIENIPAAASC